MVYVLRFFFASFFFFIFFSIFLFSKVSACNYFIKFCKLLKINLNNSSEHKTCCSYTSILFFIVQDPKQGFLIHDTSVHWRLCFLKYRNVLFVYNDFLQHEHVVFCCFLKMKLLLKYNLN